MFEETFYFDSFEAIEPLFARDIKQNLRQIENCFSVKAVARDLWIKLSSPNSGNVHAGIAAIGELSNLHAQRTLKNISEIDFCTFTSKDVVRHSLVEKIINAYQTSMPVKRRNRK